LYAQMANAQSANDQTRLLLEVQQMRQEIAELRDTVDRQAYQLKKIRSELDQVPQAAYNQPQQQISQPNLVDGSVVDGALVTGTGQQNTLQTPNASASAINSNTTGVVDQSGGVPTTATQGNNQEQYPPVIDRSVLSSGSSGVADSYNGTSTTSDANTASTSDDYISANDYNLANGADSSGVSTDILPVNRYPDSTPTQGVPQYRLAEPVSVGSANSSSSTSGTGVIAVPSAPVVPVSQGSVASSTVANTGASSPSSQEIEQVVPAPVQQAILPEQDYYQQGFELLKQSRHEQAVSVFTQQINAHPQGDFADDAFYWIAESMYVNRKLDVAKTNFKTILDNYKQSPRVPDAMLKIAYIEQDQGNQIEARLLLQDIMQYHPSSNAAISAKNRLAQLN